MQESIQKFSSFDTPQSEEILQPKKIFSVTEITYAIKNQLENAFYSVRLQGEISNYKEQSSGHLYFTLKDANAQISCVCFKSQAQKLKNPLKIGDHILITGDISVYAPRGNYQIIVKSLEVQGLGDLLLQLEALKKELKDKGYFDLERKKKLPKFPKRIGVITSPTGAVIQDIIQILNRRFPNLPILLYPVKVQGDGAKEEIAQAILDFNTHDLADVLIVGRGGGSIEDLWAFNERIVADAIFQSHIPIISAVGHETDTSISDLVADMRAPTPSAAAELVIQDKLFWNKQIQTLHQKMFLKCEQKLRLYSSQIQWMKKQPALASPYYFTGVLMQKLDEKKEKLPHIFNNYFLKKKDDLLLKKKQLQSFNPLSRMQEIKLSIQKTNKALNSLILNQLKNYQDKIKSIESHFRGIDPKNLLKKGYSILFSQKDNSIILSCKQIQKNDQIVALLGDGKLVAQVKEINHE
jgi:exodeoxyribonuclease VII large subunit